MDTEREENGTETVGLPGVALREFGDDLFESEQTLVDGDAFLSSLPSSSSGIQSL